MQGEVSGVALDLQTAGGTRLPTLVASVLRAGGEGQPLLIRTTVFDARDRRAYERELLRARQQAEQERGRLQELVATLQKSLLPSALPVVPGLQTAAYYHPASVDEIGGDFYDLFPIAPGRWGLFLGDVCGKGAHAATMTSLIRYTLRAAAAYDLDPAHVLTTLNAALYQECQRDNRNFCTAIFGLLNRRGDGFCLAAASGGHPPPLLLQADGTASFQPPAGGDLIGPWQDPAFSTATVRLAPGDTLVLYTDGLIEAHTQTPTGRYGAENLRTFAASLAPASASTAVTAITELLRTFGEGVDDDTAVLALSVDPGQHDSPRDQFPSQ